MRTDTLAAATILAHTLAGPIAVGQTSDPAEASIVIGSEVHVTKGFEQQTFWEPHIVALPTNPPGLVAVSFVVKAPPGPARRAECVIFLSSDDGISWTRLPGGSFSESRICVDPWLAVDRKGTVFLTYLHSFDETDSSFRLGAHIIRSTDGGSNWSEPVAFPLDSARGLDKPSITIDSGAGSPHRGTLYVHASAAATEGAGERIHWIAATRSPDSGRSFAPPVRIGKGHVTLNSGNPAVLSDGTLLVPFNEVGTGDARGLLRFPRIWVSRSTDAGRSFSLPYLVSEMSDAYPYVLAVDTSAGPFQDRAYIAFKGREGKSDIYVTRSDDGGMTWSAETRVNDNPDSRAFHLTPMVGVNTEGTVLVSWYDRRSDPDNLCTEVYASASIDGGVSFLPNVRVSAERSCAPDDGRGPEMQKWNVGGEYAGIAAAEDGSFHVVWSDARSGTFQLWTARIVVDAVP